MKAVVVLVFSIFVAFLAVCSCAYACKKSVEDFQNKENLQKTQQSPAQQVVKYSKEEMLKMNEEDLRHCSSEELKDILDFVGHKIHDAGDDADKWRDLYEQASKVKYQH